MYMQLGHMQPMNVPFDGDHHKGPARHYTEVAQCTVLCNHCAYNYTAAAPGRDTQLQQSSVQ